MHHPPNETHHAEREAVYVCAFSMIKNRNGRKMTIRTMSKLYCTALQHYSGRRGADLGEYVIIRFGGLVLSLLCGSALLLI